MRYLLPPLVALAAFACGDPEPGKPKRIETVTLALRADGASLAVFNTTLRADEEPNNASNSDSMGFSQIQVLGDGNIEFLLVINNRGVGGVEEVFTRAHIHKAPAGENGGIHWDLLEAGNPVASISGQPAILRGEVRPRAGADLEDLLAHPENYYVNVHSNVFPGGSIRGQLQ
ncbi:MAG TPA: CHRD domain-containing protein [Myxococcaceae bacterium]|nr:CHRD domain-containing protein [Myxococcaceae bacterium]